jgi:hypothetical protein
VGVRAEAEREELLPRLIFSRVWGMEHLLDRLVDRLVALSNIERFFLRRFVRALVKLLNDGVVLGRWRISIRLEDEKF